MKKYLTILSFCLFAISSYAQTPTEDPFTGKSTKTTELEREQLPSFEAFSKNFDAQTYSVKPIESYDLKSLMETRNLLSLIDLRGETAFNTSHISGAKEVDYNTFNLEKIWILDKNIAVILYVNLEDDNSSKVAAYMQRIGFLDVRVLDGGMISWVNKRYLIVDNEGKASKMVLVDSKAEGKKLKKAKAVYNKD
jgi:rhodanese-related sulfurtransferase